MKKKTSVSFIIWMIVITIVMKIFITIVAPVLIQTYHTKTAAGFLINIFFVVTRGIKYKLLSNTSIKKYISLKLR